MRNAGTIYPYTAFFNPAPKGRASAQADSKHQKEAIRFTGNASSNEEKRNLTTTYTHRIGQLDTFI